MIKEQFNFLTLSEKAWLIIFGWCGTMIATLLTIGVYAALREVIRS